MKYALFFKKINTCSVCGELHPRGWSSIS